MIIRFSYGKIYIDPHSEFCFLPKGFDLDEINGRLICRVPNNKLRPYFYLSFEFDSYQYRQHYQPSNQTFRQELYRRVYQIVIYLDFDKNCLNKPPTCSDKLIYYFNAIQKDEIIAKKNYHVRPSKIKQFIGEREQHLLYLINWRYFALNKKYLLNLQTGCLVSFDSIRKIYFKRYGGIIETNDVKKLINSQFSSQKSALNNLVIIPTNMQSIWKSNSAKIITYDQLLRMSKTDISKLNKQRWARIIIHECHQSFIVGIKNLVKGIDCSTVWIVNSLPLAYYLSNSDKIDLRTLFIISNIWIAIDTVAMKNMYKTELVKFFLTKLNQYYAIVEYAPPLIRNRKTIKLSPLEKQIHETYRKYFDNWKNKLTNQSDNHYSFASEKKLQNIEMSIQQSVLLLSSSVRTPSQTKNFFIDSINAHIGRLNNSKKFIHHLYQLLGNQCQGSRTYTSQVMNKTHEELQYIDSKINMISRYLETNYDTGEKCGICYEEKCTNETKLICGHSYCLDCILNSIAYKKECPLCRETISVKDMVIIKDNTDKYHSHWLELLRKADKNTIIVTDIDAIGKKVVSKGKVINIHDNAFAKVTNLQKANNVLLLTTKPRNKKTYRQLMRLVAYINLFNNPPKLKQISIAFE